MSLAIQLNCVHRVRRNRKRHFAHPTRVLLLRTCFLLAALPAAALAADVALNVPPVPVTVNIGGQPVALIVSGALAGPPYRLDMQADLADLQLNLTSVMQGQLAKSDKCGERISIQNATLVPAAPAARLTVQLHFEQWACIKALGKENAKRLVGGDGSVETVLTPRVEANTVRLDAEVGKIQANGSLGELLKSGALGNALRDKIHDAILKAVQKATDLTTLVPEEARPFVNVESMAFEDEGKKRLAIRVKAQLDVPQAELATVLDRFRNRK